MNNRKQPANAKKDFLGDKDEMLKEMNMKKNQMDQRKKMMRPNTQQTQKTQQ